jgi:type I restriction enzyme S subunit
MLPEVCIALLQTPAIKAQILSKAKNAVNQSSINQKDVCDLILPLPKMANQKSFVAAVHKIFRIEAAAIRDNTSIFALSSFLQHQAFSGQLR